jgi:hypothetical protein
VEPPRLTFACELTRARLGGFFAEPSVIGCLQALHARVALMLSDFSDERAAVVRQLNEAGVPVIGVPLLPFGDGYYFTSDNAGLAAARYHEWVEWSRRHQLTWAGVGLDIEPDGRIYQQVLDNPWRLVPMLAPRLADGARPQRAAAAYAALVAKIRADGWAVENYQFPLIADERRAGSTLLQRLGLVDVDTDREVWMLYSSFLRALGPGMIWSYGPQAQAMGVGSTGGGPDVPGLPQVPRLSWDELARDLRLARRWCDDILIHSLEGCVWHGYLERLQSFDWQPPTGPPESTGAAEGVRRALRAVLWATAHPWRVMAAITAVRLAGRAFHRTFSARPRVPQR